jgi:ABC-type multidrug transport system fused ATPase/permease subunit
MSSSEGDPRVHFVMNLVLSLAFSAVVVWGLSFIGIGTFALRNVALGTLLVMALTYLVVLR